MSASADGPWLWKYSLIDEEFYKWLMIEGSSGKLIEQIICRDTSRTQQVYSCRDDQKHTWFARGSGKALAAILIPGHVRNLESEAGGPSLEPDRLAKATQNLKNRAAKIKAASSRETTE